jgi:hypothetical protein
MSSDESQKVGLMRVVRYLSAQFSLDFLIVIANEYLARVASMKTIQCVKKSQIHCSNGLLSTPRFPIVRLMGGDIKLSTNQL